MDTSVSGCGDHIAKACHLGQLHLGDLPTAWLLRNTRCYQIHRRDDRPDHAGCPAAGEAKDDGAYRPVRKRRCLFGCEEPRHWLRPQVPRAFPRQQTWLASVERNMKHPRDTRRRASKVKTPLKHAPRASACLCLSKATAQAMRVQVSSQASPG